MVMVVAIVIIVVMIVPLVIVLMAALFRGMPVRSRYCHPARRLFGEIRRRPMIVLSIHRKFPRFTSLQI
jgi:hypothetical protein